MSLYPKLSPRKLESTPNKIVFEPNLKEEDATKQLLSIEKNLPEHKSENDGDDQHKIMSRSAKWSTQRPSVANGPKGDAENIEILPEVLELESEMIEIRRRFHRRPELAFQEFETAAFVAEKLRSFGMEVTEGVGRTGVIGLLRGDIPGSDRCIALRADMDALPLQEDLDIEYKSEIDGKMHGCGHDAHVAMLLCAAEILAKERERISGIVKFVFQPAEENGGAGALQMVNDGVLENPYVDEIYGAHLRAYRETFSVEILEGPVYASNDRFEITIEGTGGHGSRPEETEDVIYIASALNVQLQSIVGRNIGAQDSAVLTVTTFNAGATYNVISTTCKLSGTIRTYLPSVRDKIVDRISKMCGGLAEAYEVKIKFEIVLISYPPVLNLDQEQHDNCLDAIKEVVGPQGVVDDVLPSMGSEDFSFFTVERPGAFFHIGSSRTLPAPGHHSSQFFVDERCLPIGASIWVVLIRNLLQNEENTKNWKPQRGTKNGDGKVKRSLKCRAPKTNTNVSVDIMSEEGFVLV